MIALTITLDPSWHSLFLIPGVLLALPALWNIVSSGIIDVLQRTGNLTVSGWVMNILVLWAVIACFMVAL